MLLKQGKVKNPYPNVDAHSFLVKALGDCFWSDFPSSIRPFCIILCIDFSTYVLKSLYCSVECAWWISKYHKTWHPCLVSTKGTNPLDSMKIWSRSQWEKMKGGLAGSWQKKKSPFFLVSFKITVWNHVDRNMGIQGACVCAHVFFALKHLLINPGGQWLKPCLLVVYWGLYYPVDIGIISYAIKTGSRQSVLQGMSAVGVNVISRWVRWSADVFL